MYHWITLDALRPGAVFITQKGVMAVKSEYFYSVPHAQCLCILLASGEFAHFPEKNKTPVREVAIEDIVSGM